MTSKHLLSLSNPSDGLLKQSRRFEITEGDVLAVLGCLKYVLETSANMGPNSTPERDGGEPVEDHGDYEPDLDNDYLPTTRVKLTRGGAFE